MLGLSVVPSANNAVECIARSSDRSGHSCNPAKPAGQPESGSLSLLRPFHHKPLLINSSGYIPRDAESAGLSVPLT